MHAAPASRPDSCAVRCGFRQASMGYFPVKQPPQNFPAQCFIVRGPFELTCSAEVNSACAKIFAGAKMLVDEARHGRKIPPGDRGDRNLS